MEHQISCREFVDIFGSTYNDAVQSCRALLRMRTPPVAVVLLVSKARAQSEGANAAADEGNC